MADDLIAIVVAGGGSRRLGRLAGAGGKGMIEIAGEAMLSRVCRTLATVVPRVIVVARAGQPLPPLVDAAEVIHDSQPGAGPLAAIRDGLVYAGAGPGRPPRLALLASCDLPRLSTGVVRLLLDLAAPPGILAAAAKALDRAARGRPPAGAAFGHGRRPRAARAGGARRRRSGPPGPARAACAAGSRSGAVGHAGRAHSGRSRA